MKKLVSPKMQFLIVFILFSIFFIFKKTNVNNINYLSIGDGYALGINSYGIEDYGYSDFLKDKIVESNRLRFYYKGNSLVNNTIKNIYSNLTNNTKSDVEGHLIGFKEQLQEADLITMSIGINDLKYEIMLEDKMDYNKLENIVNNIEADFNILIKEIRKYYKHDIYVVGYPINSLDSYYESMGIRKINNAFKNNENIVFIDPNIIEINKAIYFSNPTSNFPNQKGYEKLAGKIFETYQKKLAK